MAGRSAVERFERVLLLRVAVAGESKDMEEVAWGNVQLASTNHKFDMHIIQVDVGQPKIDTSPVTGG